MVQWTYWHNFFCSLVLTFALSYFLSHLLPFFLLVSSLLLSFSPFSPFLELFLLQVSENSHFTQSFHFDDNLSKRVRRWRKREIEEEGQEKEEGREREREEKSDIWVIRMWWWKDIWFSERIEMLSEANFFSYLFSSISLRECFSLSHSHSISYHPPKEQDWAGEKESRKEGGRGRMKKEGKVKGKEKVLFFPSPPHIHLRVLWMERNTLLGRIKKNEGREKV